MKVLYLHPAATFGGASKSLIEMFQQLKSFGITGTVLCPHGKTVEAFKEAELAVMSVRGLSQFDNTLYGHYRGFRWFILLRELWHIPFSLYSLFKLRQIEFDIIHANEITLLPFAIILKILFKVPLVVHIRSVQCHPTKNRRSITLNYLLEQFADTVIAIDQTVAKSVKLQKNIKIIHNGINIKIPIATSTKETNHFRVKVAYVGVLLKLKGIFELIEAIKILKNRGIAIECLIAGENARKTSGLKGWLLKVLGFSSNVRMEIYQYIKDNNLDDDIKILGFIKDVRDFYPLIDILCFPSYLNAAGRPVFEAALFGKPSIVAIEEPLPDAIIDGVTGIAIEKPSPVLIANAIEKLALDSQLRSTMGLNAKHWAEEQFSIKNSAVLMHEIYHKISRRN
jgi:glycosyltransferase involved in cell wall biosynthesis